MRIGRLLSVRFLAMSEVYRSGSGLAGTDSRATREGRKAGYELQVSRIVSAPPSGVFAAFADAGRLAAWSGPSGQRWTAAVVPELGSGDPAVLEARGALPGIPVGSYPRAWLRLEFCPHPGGKTRLELRQSLFTAAQQLAARTWWNAVLTQLDDYLAGAWRVHLR